jgi:hypothetical protein
MDVGHAIVDCGWFDDWSRDRVRRTIGRAEQSRGDTSYWPIGEDPHAVGPTLALLEITFDARDGVVDTHIGSRPY